MTNPHVMPQERKRRNMNLTAGLFQKLERLKKQEERKIGVPLAWDSFFELAFDELVRRRRESAQAADQGRA